MDISSLLNDESLQAAPSATPVRNRAKLTDARPPAPRSTIKKHLQGSPEADGSRFSQVQAVLACLAEQNLSLASFLDAFLWGDPACTNDTNMRYHRGSFCKDPLLETILENLYDRPRTSTSGSKPVGASAVVQTWALNRVCRTLDSELMKFSATLDDPGLSEQSFGSITMESMSHDLKQLAPSVYSLLQALAQSDAQAVANLRKSPARTITVIACQLAYSRNTLCNKFQQLIALYMKTKSVPSKCMELVHHCGLAMSYSWVTQNITTLRKAAMADLELWLKDNNVFVLHDNIRIVFRVKTQRINNQTHGDNGTAATAVALPQSARTILAQYGELMRPYWAKRQAAFADSSPQPIRMLSIKELTEQLRGAHLREFAIHNVITVLLDSPEFTGYQHCHHHSLQPPAPIRALPTGPNHRTKQWMLGTMPIEEASYSGNEQVVDAVLGQLGLNKGAAKEKLGLGETAIPWGGDQLTDSRLKILKWLHGDDINGFERKDWLLNVFGWFHTLMILAKSVYENHRGSPKDFGLARDINLLGIKGLAATKEKPMFHTVDDFLHLEHTARVQMGWLWAADVSSMDALLQSTPSQLHALAAKIVDERASSAALFNLQEMAERDFALEGSVILLRDLDLYVQVDSSSSTAPIIRVISADPIANDLVFHFTIQLQSSPFIHHIFLLIFYFKGGSNGNYCKMLVEYMQWQLYEAPPEINELIQNHCWLVNPSGRPGHFFPADQLQEHNVNGIKSVHSATSSNVTWSYITKISPAIPILNYIGDHVDKSFSLIHGTRHAEPSPRADLRVLRKSFTDAKMLVYDPRYHATSKLACTDTFLKGLAQIQDTSYLHTWWDERKVFLAHRSTEQEFDAPPDSDTQAMEKRLELDAEIEEDYFAGFGEAQEMDFSYLDELAQTSKLAQAMEEDALARDDTMAQRIDM
ncbi:hypothetical protein BOTBODRAFT_170165 [Botryobasidium botryosum FD-172 SS1]|uniref:DUF6589 domain-containing protein n=1 Tax=Botryobasidium botryosum (strain FD-172 SS1) TaxID=930990 RepID=A0A067MWN3_BOTB1|nr:hypothetical protein BOTBODRAFT_170165 [Botryobasidium botryosum FD-172 SS1]